jgi:predicted permease
MRRLARNRRYFLGVTACLALGLGANATMFAVSDQLFFRPPAAVQDPGQLSRIYFRERVPVVGEITTDLASFPTFTDLRTGARSFEGVAAYHVTMVSEGRGNQATRLRVALVSSDYFHLLGVGASRGQVLTKLEGPLEGGQVAVISDALWRGRFGASQNALGQTLAIADRLYTVVGVAARNFTGIDLEPVSAWLPLDVAATDLIATGFVSQRGSRALSIVARQKTGVSRKQAEDDASIAYRSGRQGFPGADSSARLIMAPLSRQLGPRPRAEAKVAFWLAGVSVAVLIIAGVNCTNLMLLSTMRRRTEFAIRTALGATRSHLARLVLVETILITTLSAGAAAILGIAGGALLRRVMELDEVPLGLSALARLCVFVLAAGTVVGLLTSAPLIWSMQREDLSSPLRTGYRAGLARPGLVRGLLLVGQTTLTIVLLIGAGLFVKSLRNVRAMDLGFDAGSVLTVNVDFAGITARTRSMPDADLLYERLVSAVLGVPGVRSAAVATSIPFQYTSGASVAIPGADNRSLPREPALLSIASEAYQQTIGLRIVDGRWFARADYRSPAVVAVVNESMAKAYWPNQSAIGRCVVVAEPQCRTVVGVVADARQTRIQPEHRSQVYLTGVADPRLSARYPRTLVIRSLTPRAIVPTVRRAVMAIDPALSYVTILPLQDLVDAKSRQWTLGATAFGLFGVLALVLAALGIYSTMSNLVSERAHEIGVRVALGATGAQVVRAVMGRGLAQAIAGIVFGLVLVRTVGTQFVDLLFGASPKDVDVLVLAALVVGAASLAACFGPAQRAFRWDPAAILRGD